MKQILNIINNIEKNSSTVLYRAANKSLSKTNTTLKRNVTRTLGLKSKDISKRSKIFKAKKSKLNGAISFGTKYGISLDKFKVKTKIITVNKRKLKQVAVKINGEQVIDKANFITNSKKIFHRVGKSRLPIKKSTYDLLPYVTSQREVLKKYLMSSFNDEIKKQIKYMYK